MTIYFYTRPDDYFEFSNFSAHGFVIGDVYWRTVEHYFQAQKFAGTEYEERVRGAHTPTQAKSLGQRRDFPLREDWEAVKDDIMRQAMLAKFRAHDDLREMLLDTGDEELVEASPFDYYWGAGSGGTGKNMLGKILMETRTILREETVSNAESE